MPAIVISKKDIASQTILGQLLKHFKFVEDGKFEGGTPQFAISSNGHLYASDRGNHRVQVFK